ncbi:hypothetical protein Tco_0766410 [Tanacetum coccineum]
MHGIVHSKECTSGYAITELLNIQRTRCLCCTSQQNGCGIWMKKLIFLQVVQENAVDEDVDGAQTDVHGFISLADPFICMNGMSLCLDILSEDNVQPNYVVDSHADYTSDSNMITYDQYVKDNAVARTLYASPVQSNALYNGHEIIKTNHVPAIVHNSEDTLEIAEITRKTMNDKMKNPKCVQKKVKITPPDYSKENYLATFTPQKQLTPEQIFWSQDLIKMKAEALKTQATASRPQSIDGVSSKYTCNACPKGASNKESSKN